MEQQASRSALQDQQRRLKIPTARQIWCSLRRVDYQVRLQNGARWSTIFRETWRPEASAAIDLCLLVSLQRSDSSVLNGEALSRLEYSVADANEQWIAEVNAQSSQYLAYLGLRCIEDLRRLCQTSFVQHQGQDAEMIQADVLIIQHKMYTTPSSRMPRSFVRRMNASLGHYGLIGQVPDRRIHQDVVMSTTAHAA